MDSEDVIPPCNRDAFNVEDVYKLEDSILFDIDSLKCMELEIICDMVSGVANGMARGAECHPLQQKICQKSGKKRENCDKKSRNQEEKAKIGNVLSLFPCWQVWLATLLDMVKWNELHSGDIQFGLSTFIHLKCHISGSLSYFVGSYQFLFACCPTACVILTPGYIVVLYFLFRRLRFKIINF